MATLLPPTKSSIWRYYANERARNSALTQLKKTGKYNYFLFYLDIHGPALQAAVATWVEPGDIYVSR